MKNDPNALKRFDSLVEAHRIMGLPEPKHPLISIINACQGALITMPSEMHVLSFYKISYKPKFSGKLRYGQSYYDFDGGGLLFAYPGQILGSHESENESEDGDVPMYTLLIHPDFLWNHALAKKIKQYGFFSYSANEALHLSEAEKEIVISIYKMVESELNSRIDDFSQSVILSQVELLFNYADRFYKRQFLTRKAANSDLLQQLEEILDAYFQNGKSLSQGTPTVHYLAGQLHLSPSYLSDMLRVTTGQNAQQHIHERLIGKAKEILSTTNLPVSEVAYALGFEHPQSFSKLFRKKTQLSPLEFRKSFN